MLLFLNYVLILQIDLSEIFNSREVAYICWIIVGFISIIAFKSLRNEILPIVNSFFNRHFIPVYVLTFLYISACSFLLSKLNFWDTELLKDTVVWGLFTALPMIFYAIQAKNLSNYFGSTFKDLFKVTIVVEFVMGLYTFSLLIELLLVPFTVFLAGLLIFSSHDEKNKKANKLFNWISWLLGVLLVIGVLQHMIEHFGEYWDISYFKQFLLPITLSITFIPFLYFVVCYARFEETFAAMTNNIKSPQLLKYTKLMLFFNFIGNLEGIVRWRQHISRFQPQDRLDIKAAILHIKESQRRENKQLCLNPEEGWSPYLAKDFLNAYGISTEFYVNLYMEEWGVVSNSKKIGANSWGNSITYSVFGSKIAATALKLRLEVVNVNSIGDDEFIFLDIVGALYQKVFGQELPTEIYTDIFLHTPKTIQLEAVSVILDKSPYGNHLDGYSLKFSLIHKNHIEWY